MRSTITPTRPLATARFTRRMPPRQAPRAPPPSLAPAPASAPLPPRRGESTIVNAASGVYICIDCGWLYLPKDNKGEAFAAWKGKCPACRAPKSRFKPYSGSSLSNDNKSR